jgi:hypothetical protein
MGAPTKTATAVAVLLGVLLGLVLVMGRTLRALVLVLLLVLGAVDALVTAALGVRPLAFWLATWRREIASEARRGYRGAIEAPVLDDDEDDGADEAVTTRTREQA